MINKQVNVRVTCSCVGIERYSSKIRQVKAKIRDIHPLCILSRVQLFILSACAALLTYISTCTRDSTVKFLFFQKRKGGPSCFDTFPPVFSIPVSVQTRVSHVYLLRALFLRDASRLGKRRVRVSGRRNLSQVVFFAENRV